MAGLFCLSGLAAEEPAARQLSDEQQLVVAAFDLDVARVKTLLDKGVSPDVRMGSHEQSQFKDKWTLAWPMLSNRWTPLMAVAESHREPQPATPAENTVDGLKEANRRRNAIDPKLIAERDRRRVEIAKLLIAAKAGLDFEDGRGATALEKAVYQRYDDLALLLIAAGAEVNTKTGVYIDGTDDITPLHRAVNSPAVLEAMLKHGARVDVKDSTGRTPLHWAASDANVKSTRLLLDAGADPAAKDNEGQTPAYWCKTFPGSVSREDADKRAIMKMLLDAGKK